jgi:hypothetical protein
MTLSSRLANFVWHSSQHLLAIVITALSLSTVPVTITITVGTLGVIFGIVESVLVFFGGRPPIIGSIIAITLTLAMALITIVVSILILVLAHIFIGLVVAPIILLIHWCVEYWQIKSRVAMMAFYAAAGIVIAVGLGLVIYGWIASSGWQNGANPWTLAGIYTVCLATGFIAVFIYQSVLSSTDAVRLFIARLIQRWSNGKVLGG